MNRDGFSLIELIVIIGIIGILLSVAVPNYHAWQVKSSVEKQTKELKADLDNVRLAAIQQKLEQGVVIEATRYTVKSYSSPEEADEDGTVVSVKNVAYPIQTDGGVIRFDIRGFTAAEDRHVWTTAAPEAGFDSLIISTAKTVFAKRQTDGTYIEK